jgi:hypothetical protein
VLHDDQKFNSDLARELLSRDQLPLQPKLDKTTRKFIHTLKRKCIREAKRIEPLGLTPASTVLPSILRCVARQLDAILHDYLPVEIQAMACRILFELRDYTQLMATDPERISKFLAERWSSEYEVLELMQQLHPAKWIRNRLQMLRTKSQGPIQRSGVKRKEGDNKRLRAERNGHKEELDTFYRLLCLYVHATGMLAAEEYQTGYRLAFMEHAKTYAQECFENVMDCVANLQIGTAAGLTQRKELERNGSSYPTSLA